MAPRKPATPTPPSRPAQPAQPSASQARGFKARQETYLAMLEAGLRDRKDTLRDIGAITEPMKDEDWKKLALEVAQKRSVNGIPIESLGDDVVQDVKDAGKAAIITGKTVEENTGNMGFLKGATIGQAFRGLMEWIFSGFTGGFDGLFTAIKGETGKSLGGALRENLGKGGVDKGTIDRLVPQVLKEGGLSTEEPPKAPERDKVKDFEQLKKVVEGRVMGALGLKKDGDKVVKDDKNPSAEFTMFEQALGKDKDGKPKKLNETELKAYVTTLTDAASEAMKKPREKDQNSKDYATQVQQTFEDQIKAKRAEMGIPDGEKGDKMIKLLSNEMAQKYLDSRPVDKEAATEFKKMAGPENNKLKGELITEALKGLPGAETVIGFFGKGKGTEVATGQGR